VQRNLHLEVDERTRADGIIRKPLDADRQRRWRRLDTHIYDRLLLPVGTRILGPALLEQSDATIWIEPDLQGEVDRFGNLLIKRIW
jgi:N-methylhydantoinase A/oxoprolinase/acetone carboxylase beta subunit